jgi:putative ABC transport system ATP-binding protein
MLQFRNVTKTYGQGSQQVVALRNVSLTIDPGEFIAATGPSGCGKSTLLHLACGLDIPTEGEVIVDGRSTADRTDDELTLLRRNRIGLVFQSFNLIPTLTALENVVLPTTLSGQSFVSQMKAGIALLAQVGLADRAGHYPDQLSGGEAQRVAVARSLVMNPIMLLADEPTGNLDSESGLSIIKILELFGSSSADGILRSTLIVTHDEAIASRAARRIRLKDGVLA